MYGRQPIDISVSHQCFSLCLSLFVSPSLCIFLSKSNEKISSGEDKKKSEE